MNPHTVVNERQLKKKISSALRLSNFTHKNIDESQIRSGCVVIYDDLFQERLEDVGLKTGQTVVHQTKARTQTESALTGWK